MNTCLENTAVPSLNLLDTVVQGDCVEVMRQLPQNSIDLIVTDPPYLARYRSRDGRTLQNDSDSSWLVPAFREAFRVLRKDRFMLCFYGWPKIDEFFAAWRGAGDAASWGDPGQLGSHLNKARWFPIRDAASLFL